MDLTVDDEFVWFLIPSLIRNASSIYTMPMAKCPLQLQHSPLAPISISVRTLLNCSDSALTFLQTVIPPLTCVLQYPLIWIREPGLCTVYMPT